MMISPAAGTLSATSDLVDVAALIDAYYKEKPDASCAEQVVSFGTSGHRGSSFDKSFNENHILAITQAICLYRQAHGIDGPLFMGRDTHALSGPALSTALEVLAANGVTVLLSQQDRFTPTPAISHAILSYNKGRKEHLADGIVITPSHNPPSEGGFKYNPPHGGPAEQTITTWIETKANEFLSNNLRTALKIPLEKALKASTTQYYDYVDSYVRDLRNVVDMELIKNSKIKMGVDPLGGAGIDYWQRMVDLYGIDLTILNKTVDPTFSFMPIDWDGKIRMDPSSKYAMRKVIEEKENYQIVVACDTDHDRHGIVTRSEGLLLPNHFFSVAVHYLFRNRPQWQKSAAIGKTVVSSQMIDRIAKKLNRELYEVPVGFKWFVDRLLKGSLAFGCEESAGASFLRHDGSVWTTDKDGMILSLLAGEITAKMGADPAQLYKGLTQEFGTPFYARLEGAIDSKQRQRLKNIAPKDIGFKDLGGEKVLSILTTAPGNGVSIGGIKIVAENSWFALRPSGTENIYKLYGESFLGAAHLDQILKQAQALVSQVMGGV